MLDTANSASSTAIFGGDTAISARHTAIYPFPTANRAWPATSGLVSRHLFCFGHETDAAPLGWRGHTAILALATANFACGTAIGRDDTAIYPFTTANRAWTAAAGLVSRQLFCFAHETNAAPGLGEHTAIFMLDTAVSAYITAIYGDNTAHFARHTAIYPFTTANRASPARRNRGG